MRSGTQPDAEQVRTGNNVHFSGRGERVIMFAHGFGCDQTMWRLVAPAFEADHRVVLFDYVGGGKSDSARTFIVRLPALGRAAAEAVAS